MQDVELVWRVLQALVARLDLGGMGPSVASALDPRRMTLARKDVSTYVGAVIPFYANWTHCNEFLTRGQRRGETVEEYFRAKRDLLMDGDAYRDKIAAYPAYWSGLRRLELVILMDALVLGHIWPGQIMDRDPQIEEWAANTAPDVGALQKLLSNLDDQRAVWSQVRLSAGVGAEASERRGTLVETPRERPRWRDGTTWSPPRARTRSWVPLGSWRRPAHQGRHCTWGKRCRAARARGG